MSQNNLPNSNSPIIGGASIVKAPVDASDQVDPKVRRANELMKAAGVTAAGAASETDGAKKAREPKAVKLDKLLQGPTPTAKQVSAAVDFSETLPKVSRGKAEGSSLVGLMDGMLGAAKAVPGAKGGLDAKTGALLERELRDAGGPDGIKFKNADGTPAQLDVNGARSVVRTFETMAQGKYEGAQLSAENRVSLLAGLFRMMPQKSPVYRQLVASFLQARTDRPSTSATPQQVKSDLYADMKANLGPLLRYNPFDTGPVTLDSGKDSFQAPQMQVLSSLKGWYTTLQVYSQAKLPGTDSALIDRVLKSIESKMGSLRGYAGPSDASGASFSRVTGRTGVTSDILPPPGAVD